MSNLQRKATIGFLIVIALLDLMGLGMVVTIFPHLFLDQESPILPLSMSLGTRLTLLGIYLAIYPLGQFFGAVILGKLSDHHGRKKIMIISLFGTLIGFILSAISIINFSPVLLLISRLLAGLFAGNLAIAQASMADISDEKTKTRNLTYIQISLGLAWVFGPPLGGWLAALPIKNLPGATTPFIFMSVCFAIITFYTLFYYQETLKEKISSSQNKIFSGFQQISLAFSSNQYRALFVIWFIFVSGWWLFESFLPSYLLKIFHYTSAEIGTFLASMGATYALFQYLVVQRIAKNVSPENMVKYSLWISGLSVLSIYLTHNTFELHVAITLFVTSMGFALPGLITTISNQAGQDDQGLIMGMISSVQAIATVLMMMIGGYLDNGGITLSLIGGGILLLFSWTLFISRFRKIQTLPTEVND